MAGIYVDTSALGRVLLGEPDAQMIRDTFLRAAARSWRFSRTTVSSRPAAPITTSRSKRPSQRSESNRAQPRRRCGGHAAGSASGASAAAIMSRRNNHRRRIAARPLGDRHGNELFEMNVRQRLAGPRRLARS